MKNNDISRKCLQKEVTTKEDGRYIIYFYSKDNDYAPENKHSQRFNGES